MAETWTEPYIGMLPTPVVDSVGGLALPSLGRFNPSKLPLHVAEASRRAKIEWHDAPPPPQAEVLAIFHPHVPEGRIWQLAHKAIPSAHRLHPLLFTKPGVPPRALTLTVGERRTTLMKAVAAVSNYLKDVPDIMPEDIYALLWYVTRDMGCDDDGTPWLDALWQFATHFWSLDKAESRASAAAQLEEERQTLDLVEQMIAGMAEWHPGAAGLTGAAAKKFVIEHLVARVDRVMFLLGRNGRYGRMPLTPATVLNRMERLGYGRQLLPIKRNDGGGYKSPADVLTRCSTLVVRAAYATDHHTAGIIERVGTDTACLLVECYRLRTDLTPTYSANVDAWLRAMGGSRYEELCEWIGHALAYQHGPLPLLALTGEADAGKGMLARGLSECLVEPVLAGPDDLFGDYGDLLMASPFVVVNEGWPAFTGKGKHPTDRLREVIGERSIYINQKYLPRFELRTNVRILVTGNATKILNEFANRRDLGPDEHKAIAQRIIHIEIPHGAAAWLKGKGGYRFTGEPGQRWVTGQGGEPSDYVLARHFFWLYRKLGYGTESVPVRYDRFLMTGEVDQPSLRLMRGQGSSTPWVVRTLVKMLNEWGEWWDKPKPEIARHLSDRNSSFYSLAFEQDVDGAPHLFVLASGLDSYADKAHDNKKPDLRGIGEALTSLCVTVDVDRFPGISRATTKKGFRCVLQSREKVDRQRWRLVDLELLYDVAQEAQMPCPLLSRINEGASVVSFKGMFPPAPPAWSAATGSE